MFARLALIRLAIASSALVALAVAGASGPVRPLFRSCTRRRFSKPVP